jgi:hypothetical protein
MNQAEVGTINIVYVTSGTRMTRKFEEESRGQLCPSLLIPLLWIRALPIPKK